MRTPVRRICLLVAALGLGGCDAGGPNEPVRGVVPQSRGTSPAPLPASQVAPAPRRSDLVVHGVGIGEHRRPFALISVDGGAPAFVETGDSLGEEQLVQIGDDFVVTQAQGAARKISVGGRVKPIGPSAATPPRVASSLGATTTADDLHSNRAFEKLLFDRDTTSLR
jgi:hypothetical protein